MFLLALINSNDLSCSVWPKSIALLHPAECWSPADACKQTRAPCTES